MDYKRHRPEYASAKKQRLTELIQTTEDYWNIQSIAAATDRRLPDARDVTDRIRQTWLSSAIAVLENLPAEEGLSTTKYREVRVEILRRFRRRLGLHIVELRHFRDSVIEDANAAGQPDRELLLETAERLTEKITQWLWLVASVSSRL